MSFTLVFAQSNLLQKRPFHTVCGAFGHPHVGPMAHCHNEESSLWSKQLHGRNGSYDPFCNKLAKMYSHFECEWISNPIKYHLE